MILERYIWTITNYLQKSSPNYKLVLNTHTVSMHIHVSFTNCRPTTSKYINSAKACSMRTYVTLQYIQSFNTNWHSYILSKESWIYPSTCSIPNRLMLHVLYVSLMQLELNPCIHAGIVYCCGSAYLLRHGSEHICTSAIYYQVDLVTNALCVKQDTWSIWNQILHF